MYREKVLDELVTRYAHRMPFPERARTLMTLWLQNHQLPGSEWDMLALSLLASISEPLFLHLFARPEKARDFFELTRTKEVLDPGRARENLQRRLISGGATQGEEMNSFRLVNLSAIAVLDLLSILGFDEVTLALSRLSDAIASTAVYIAEHRASDEMGIPYHAGEQGKLFRTRSAFFALGKWGAEELNYCSDIDLVTFYEAEGRTDRGFSNQDYFDRTARTAFELLSSGELAGGGFKVDFDLRPRGKDGRLTLPMESALEYYGKEARFWEKQAWIKARPFYGDMRLGEGFIASMHALAGENPGPAFVRDEVRRSRARTISSLPAPERDLKEGKGSIRDIEFGVQAMQLASGRPVERHTIKALHLLKADGVITPAEEEDAVSSYRTLRRAEHFVQLTGMRQCRLEPSTRTDREGLKRFLGEEGDPAELMKISRKKAERFFSRAMESLSEGISFLPGEGRIEADLKTAGVLDADRIAPMLARFYSGLYGSKMLEGGGIELLHSGMVDAAASLKGFQAALRSLENIALSIGPSGERGGWPGLPDSVPAILKLVGSSGVVSDYLRTIPRLLDRLEKDRRDIVPGTEEDWTGLDLGGMALRQKELFFGFISGEVLEGSGDFLGDFTAVAENIVKILFERAAGGHSSNMALFALGRLGFKEMLFGSDLDLLIVKREEWLDPSDKEGSATMERKIAARLVESLSAITPCGSLYDIDLRLRPYGTSGVLVPSAQMIAGYFAKDARLWERMSYCKMRPLAGDPELAKVVMKTVAESGSPPDEQGVSKVRELISGLKSRNAGLEGELKFGEGGLFDQDVLVTSAALSKRGLAPSGSGFEGLADALLEEGLFAPAEVSLIKEARRFFLKALYRSRIAGVPAGRVRHPDDLPWGAWDGREEEKFRMEVLELTRSRFPSLPSKRR